MPGAMRKNPQKIIKPKPTPKLNNTTDKNNI